MAPQRVLPCSSHVEGFSHLEPSKQNVKVRSPSAEPPLPAGAFDLTEPPEEQEEVSGTYPLVREMDLRSVHLPERGQPAQRPRDQSPLEVGVEVSGILRSDPAAGQVGHELRDFEALELEFTVTNPPSRRWDGKREEASVGEDGAGASAVA
jgi:hypothetical protein